MNFKKLIAGSTLALSLLGAYDVAKEMTQPNTMEAQAATAYWNKDKAKQLDQFMQRWQREMGQTYRKGNYGVSWGDSNQDDGLHYYTDDSDFKPVIGNWDNYHSMYLYPSSTASKRDVYNVVARYYRTRCAISDSYRYIFTIYNGKPKVYMTRQSQSGFYDNYGNELIFYTPTANKTLQDGFARIVNQKPKQKEPKSTSCDQLLSAKGKATLYGNKFITKKKGTSKDSEVFRAKSYFTYKGKKYYSAYQTDSKGNSVWRGYVEEKKVNKLNSQKDYKTCVVKGKNYGIYNNLYFTKKVSTGSKYYNKTVIAKYKYRLSNGKTYYSIYQKDKFLGYMDVKALKAK